MLNNVAHIPGLLVKVIYLQERHFWLLKLLQLQAYPVCRLPYSASK